MATPKREKSRKYAGIYWRMAERPDGQGLERMYYIVYRRGGRNSKVIEEPVGRASSGMTESKANLLRAERIAGKELSNSEKRQEEARKSLNNGKPNTVHNLWLLYAEHNREKPTIEKMDRAYFNFLAPLQGRLIDTLTTKDIADLHRRLASTPSRRTNGASLSPQTIKHILGLLKRIINFAVKLGICAMPPDLHFTMPKVDNQKTEAMTQEQLRAYLQALDEEDDQDTAAILRLALFTGMRKGALLALQWSDIDFEHGYILLRGEAAKNGKTAWLPLTPAAREILLHIARTDSAYVFPGRNGGKRYDFQKMPRRVRDKAGLPKDFRPMHGLRHSYASALASSGKVDLYTLQKLLTHGNPAMTQRYAHLADEALKRAANVADDIFTVDQLGNRA